MPSITELLFDLGLGAQIVGRTRFCIHPAAAVRNVPAVGGTKKIRLDRLLDLQPSHVILNIDENSREMADAIRAAGPEIVVTHPVTPRDNRRLYRLMGGIFDRAGPAEDLCEKFEAAYDRLEQTARDLPARDVLYLIWRDPWMTVSRDTYVSEMLDLVNWRTLCHDAETRYPEVTLTPALLAAADLVLLSTEPFAFGEDDVTEFSREHGLGPGRVRLIDGEYTSWYGSRAIAGLAWLERIARAWA